LRRQRPEGCAGNPRLDQARVAAHKAAAVANEAAAERYASSVLPIIREVRKAGGQTLREIAEALNAREFRRLAGDNDMPRQ
jgi:hypothetical protein